MLKRSLCTILVLVFAASSLIALAAAGPATTAATSSLPPPGSQTYTGTLDPIAWRALPPAGRNFLAWEKWTIKKAGNSPLAVDVSAVATQAQSAANKKVVAYGRYKTGTTPDGKSVRYFYIQFIQQVTP